MKIAILQSANLGFFPRFYRDLKQVSEGRGDEIVSFAPNSGQNRRNPLPKQILWGFRWNWFFHYYMYKLTGLQDIWSPISTLDLILKLRRERPDIIHFHIVNQWDICFPMLISYINKNSIPVIWTFHDTRAFTGRCANFDIASCEKWISGCGGCPRDALYWPSFIDNTHMQWRLRKRWFNGINSLYIVTPSEWLAGLVRSSFLKKKPVSVIYNGIDVSTFSKPQRIEIPQLKNINKRIILGVAARWQKRKGLESMLWLSEHIPQDLIIVLVGVTPELRDALPNNIIGIPRTNSKDELIAIYQRASVFVNPTLADNFPTVNIEALGAGIPVVTFRTGGSSECLDEKSGISVPKGDNKALLSAVLKVISNPDVYSKENCIKRSKDFSLSQYDKYVELYHLINIKNTKI